MAVTKLNAQTITSGKAAGPSLHFVLMMLCSCCRKALRAKRPSGCSGCIIMGLLYAVICCLAAQPSYRTSSSSCSAVGAPGPNHRSEMRRIAFASDLNLAFEFDGLIALWNSCIGPGRGEAVRPQVRCSPRIARPTKLCGRRFGRLARTFWLCTVA
eukprot:scaffold147612_cov39-Prasinocladus_malaysianus.AAC.1